MCNCVWNLHLVNLCLSHILCFVFPKCFSCSSGTKVRKEVGIWSHHLEEWVWCPGCPLELPSPFKIQISVTAATNPCLMSAQGLQPSLPTVPLLLAATDASVKPSLLPGCTNQLTKAAGERDVLIWF